MKKKSRRRRRKAAYRTDINPAFDLFGEIPVTIPETHAWVAIVAPRWFRTRRMQFYIDNWAVVDKVRAWKQRGLWDDEIADPARAVLGCEDCKTPCGL